METTPQTANYDHLKLENQLCFPVYAASRLIIRAYQPHLDELGITYPQYLTLMVLWEEETMTVNEIAHKLLLNTNTITPLLKRLESMKLVSRSRGVDDERKVMISLTDKGRSMRENASAIPFKLVANLEAKGLTPTMLLNLKQQLHQLIEGMQGMTLP